MFIEVTEFKPYKSLAVPFRGTMVLGVAHRVPAAPHTRTFPKPAGSIKSLLCYLFLSVHRVCACSCRKREAGGWLGGMFGPLHAEPNDCVLQEVTLGKHLLEQKAKPHLSIPRALQASNPPLRRCVLTAFRVCLLNPLRIARGQAWFSPQNR